MTNLSIHLIKELYYNKKLSTPEISRKLGVGEWTIYKCMKKTNLPRRTAQEANKVRFDKKPITFALKRNLSLKDEELKLAGIMLYWTEGSKPNPENRVWTVDFANSDPRMIKLFIRFLRKICGVDERRLRVFLYCYTDQDIDALKKYWHKVTSVPLTQFTKPYVRKDFLLEKSGRMKYGLVHIRYSDKKLLIQIGDWLRDYLKRNYLG